MVKQILTWEMVAAVATVVTAVIAALVWVEARKIRRSDWLSRSVEMWQAFNGRMLQGDLALRWHRFLDGSLPNDEVTATDLHVLYSYVNIIFSEYTLAKARLIDPIYARQSVEGNIKQLADNRSFIARVLLRTGYDERFVFLIRDYPHGNWPSFLTKQVS